MALQPKPLRFLYKKYAGHAPRKEKNDKTQSSETFTTKKSESLGSLHLLGREISKLERIQMFFATSEEQCECPSVANSVSSASTRNRSCCSIKTGGQNMSHHFRSRSQEFQKKYKLAASRCSPEYAKQTSQVGSGSSYNTQLPRLYTNGARTQENGRLLTELKHTDDPRSIIQVMIGDRMASGGVEVKPAEIRNYHLDNNDSITYYTGAKTPSSFSASSSRPRQRSRPARVDRVPAGQLPRCQTRSTVDADRLDSSHYQYLLDDFSSQSSSSTLQSVKSDPASTKASARAQRPSTSDTIGTVQRLRDLHTCTEYSTPVCPPALSNSFRSPDLPWPPRYALIPSWPSYEDIQTLNSCGDHRDIMTRLYQKDKDGRYRRRSRDRGYRVSFWNRDVDGIGNEKKKVHVVPSHTNTECAMCNLYKRAHQDHTMCPPNTPLVISHDCCDQHSRPGTNFSLKVNRSGVSAPSTKSSARLIGNSNNSVKPFIVNGHHNQDLCSTSPKPLNTRPVHGTSISSGGSHTKSGKGVSYSWDTCRISYVKAHA